MEYKDRTYEMESYEKFPSAFPAQHQNRQPGLEYVMKPRPISSNGKKFRRLEGKTALITGGDSGIGRAVSYSFVKRVLRQPLFIMTKTLMQRKLRSI